MKERLVVVFLIIILSLIVYYPISSSEKPQHPRFKKNAINNIQFPNKMYVLNFFFNFHSQNLTVLCNRQINCFIGIEKISLLMFLFIKKWHFA